VKAIPRFLAAAACLLAVSSVASACDTSPYAAKVNSQVIKETALNEELSAWAGNRQYVSAFDSGSGGATVVGDAPGTYNNQWVSSILSGTVTADVVHQRLQATGRHVSQAGLQAARAVSEISQIGWTNFPRWFRDTLVARLADAALITPQSVDSQTIARIYQQYLPYFFSRVCVLQAAAFSLPAARNLSASKHVGGSPVCYNQSQLETQATGLREAIMSLGPGQVSQPVRTPYGYLVVKVTGRDVIKLTSVLARTISVAYNDAVGAPNKTINALVAHAKVRVNPAYGSWQGNQVVPPRTPGSST
jgi:hypothetical protein